MVGFIWKAGNRNYSNEKLFVYAIGKLRTDGTFRVDCISDTGKHVTEWSNELRIFNILYSSIFEEKHEINAT